MVSGHSSHECYRSLTAYSTGCCSDSRKGCVATTFRGNTIHASWPSWRSGRKTIRGCYFKFLEIPRRYEMKTMRTTVLCLVVLLLAAPSIRAQDFSKYRNFSLGTNLVTVVKHTDQRLLDVKATHDGSLLFQELTWH